MAIDRVEIIAGSAFVLAFIAFVMTGNPELRSSTETIDWKEFQVRGVLGTPLGTENLYKKGDIFCNGEVEIRKDPRYVKTVRGKKAQYGYWYYLRPKNDSIRAKVQCVMKSKKKFTELYFYGIEVIEW